MCGCSLKLVRIGLGIFYFILFFVCVLCGFVLGCSLGLSLLLLNFVVELVKFISDLRSIKFVWPLKRLTILLRGQNANLLKQIAKINTYIHTYIHTYIYIYIYTLKKKLKKIWGPTIVPSPTVGLYVLNMYTNIHTNQLFFTVRFINSYLFFILNYKNLNLKN